MVTLTACTSKPEVTEADIQKRGLTVPQELNSPVKSQEFTIPEVKNASDLDRNREITSPTTVLIMLESSWVDSQEKHPAKINYEKLPQVDDLKAFISKGITSLFNKPNAQVNQNENVFTVETTTQIEQGFWFWASMVDVERMIYHVELIPQSHGRSISVKVDMVDYEVLKPELMPSYAISQRKASLATQTLNDISLELSYLYRVQIQEQQDGAEITLELAKNISGSYVLRSQQDIKQVWKKVEDLIDELGFDIEEEDKELYIYELTYEKPSKSIWQGLFGGEVLDLGIADGAYSVSLVSTTTGVEIGFKDSKGNYLSQKQMETIFAESRKIVNEDEIEL